MEESEERSSFLWQIISRSLIGPLIIAVRDFQRFSDRIFFNALELIFILKLDYTVKVPFKTQKDHHSNKYFLTISSTASICVLEVSE